MPTPFDPLRFLRSELHAEAHLTDDGRVGLRFQGRVEARGRRRALAVVEAYERLLRMQLDSGGASVQKLMAHGKIRIEGGRYVWK